MNQERGDTSPVHEDLGVAGVIETGIRCASQEHRLFIDLDRRTISRRSGF